MSLSSLKVAVDLDGWFANQLAIWINVIRARFCNAMLGQLVAAPQYLDLGNLFQVFQSFLNTVTLDLTNAGKCDNNWIF